MSTDDADVTDGPQAVCAIEAPEGAICDICVIWGAYGRFRQDPRSLIQDPIALTLLSNVFSTRVHSAAQPRLFLQGANHNPMLRSFTLALAAFVGTLSFAQQFALDWATPLMPANNRVKVASTGGAFA